jgi:hypothetical protein
MDTGPERVTGDVELEPDSGFELLPQPLIPRASTATKTDCIVFIVASPKKRVPF